MEITIFKTRDYDRGAKVRWLLEEMGMPYKDHKLDVDKGERESEFYLKVNPLGRTPAVLIDGRPMIESSAICMYLADRFTDKNLAPSLASPERMAYQQWANFAAVTMESFQTRIGIIEDIPPGAVFNKKSETLYEEVRDVFKYIHDTLAGKNYILGQFSTADILMAYPLYFSFMWPELKVLADPYPNVEAYLKRLQARPAAQKSRMFSFEG